MGRRARDRIRMPARHVFLKGVLLGGGVALVVVVNVFLLGFVSRAQAEAEALVAANEATATALSEAQATLDEQEVLRGLVFEQTRAVEERVAELEVLKEEQVATAHEVSGAVTILTECHDAQLGLIDYLWTTGTQLYGGEQVAAVKKRCDAAVTAFGRVAIDE